MPSNPPDPLDPSDPSGPSGAVLGGGPDPTAPTGSAAPPVPGWMSAQLDQHLATASALGDLLPAVVTVAEVLVETFAQGRSVWTFGNGGSAADAQHLSGELIGRYRRDRRPLPCLTLGADAVVTTCTANDYDYAEVFARQVRAVARPGDVVCAFSTSGTSANVVAGLQAARANQAVTVLFGGRGGGTARALADHALVAPSDATARIQEMHTLMLHMISEHVDVWAAGGQEPNP